MVKLIVTATVLNIRSEPSLQGQIIGTIRQKDVVEQLDISANGQLIC